MAAFFVSASIWSSERTQQWVWAIGVEKRDSESSGGNVVGFAKILSDSLYKQRCPNQKHRENVTLLIGRLAPFR